MNEKLTPLEREIVALTARENWTNFREDGLRVVKRENTGAGRFVYLEDKHCQILNDGLYSAEGRLIEMTGVQNGLGFVVVVSSSHIDYIELFTYGNIGWDGIEREWRIV